MVICMSVFLIIFQSRFFQYPWPELAAAFLLPHLYIAVQQLRHRRQAKLFRLVTENAADMIAARGGFRETPLQQSFLRESAWLFTKGVGSDLIS
jgi:hypothetical protein